MISMQEKWDLGDLRADERLVDADPVAALREAAKYSIDGRFQEAARIYHRALAAAPDDPDALHGCAMMHAHRGEKALALDLLYKAYCAQPESAEISKDLALFLAEAGREKEALDLARNAIRVNPEMAEAHGVYGAVLRKLGCIDDAVSAWSRALELQPDYADVHRWTGEVLLFRGEVDRAVHHLHKAVKLSPESSSARLMLGLALQAAGDLVGALGEFREVVRLSPLSTDGHCNLGVVLHMTGKLKDAVVSLNRAVELSPGGALGRLNLAFALLALGDFARGWPAFEWRRFASRERLAQHSIRLPEWNGCSLTGQRIVVICEEGLGDSIQFVRYARLLARRGAKVIVECQAPLVPLFRSACGVSQTVARGQPLPECDMYVRMMSLPGVFNTSVSTIPQNVPYLKAERDRVLWWKPRITGKLKIGIAWQGNRMHVSDRFRSFRLKMIKPLSHVCDARLYSLQKGAGSEQVNEVDFPVVPFESALDDCNAFLDTAAMIMNLDLVVTSDTSVAHLAGALGVPVWLALSASPDWRWLTRRSDSPWYPSMRLFRQDRLGEWEPVFERIALAAANEFHQLIGGTG